MHIWRGESKGDGENSKKKPEWALMLTLEDKNFNKLL